MMIIELSRKEIEIILDHWFNCYQNEGNTHKMDRNLVKKLEKYMDDCIEEENGEAGIKHRL